MQRALSELEADIVGAKNEGRLIEFFNATEELGYITKHNQVLDNIIDDYTVNESPFDSRGN